LTADLIAALPWVSSGIVARQSKIYLAPKPALGDLFTRRWNLPVILLAILSTVDNQLPDSFLDFSVRII
jgi:hypothetical protein